MVTSLVEGKDERTVLGNKVHRGVRRLAASRLVRQGKAQLNDRQEEVRVQEKL